MANETSKLTKKQKKALAFREHTSGKGKEKEPAIDAEDNDVPAMDLLDDEVVENDLVEKERKANSVKISPSKKESGKRKREDALVETENAGPSKKKKKEDMTEKKSKQRFILFVGNLKYTTTTEEIIAHFAACDPPPTARLLTPKAGPNGKPTAKSKGCAFLEFTHRNALQQGLKLHQSLLDGRMINVELTAGGGGKGEGRIAKVQQRNKTLAEQRSETLLKQAKEDGSLVSTSQRPQRYSTTSGLSDASKVSRTWSVGEDGEKHRGGQKHKKARPSKPSKDWGSGANAIPVG